MLDSAGPEQLEEWAAFHSLHPWGDEWHRTSLVLARLINTLQQLAAGLGGQKLSDGDWIEDDAFVPKPRKKKKERGMSPAAGFALMRNKIGA